MKLLNGSVYINPSDVVSLTYYDSGTYAELNILTRHSGRVDVGYEDAYSEGKVDYERLLSVLD